MKIEIKIYKKIGTPEQESFRFSQNATADDAIALATNLVLQGGPDWRAKVTDGTGNFLCPEITYR